MMVLSGLLLLYSMPALIKSEKNFVPSHSIIVMSSFDNSEFDKGSFIDIEASAPTSFSSSIGISKGAGDNSSGKGDAWANLFISSTNALDDGSL